MNPTATTGLVPRNVALSVGALLLVALAGVAAVRLTGINIHAPDALAQLTRELRFEDRADGGVAVIDARTNTLVDTVTGEAGFFRGTLRGLARERRRNGFGPEAPFQLIGRADGRLTLADPATGQRVDLESFGPTNVAVFARFLTVGLPNTPNSTNTLNSPNPRTTP